MRGEIPSPGLCHWGALVGLELLDDPAEMETWLTTLTDAGADILHCSQRRLWEPEFEGSDLNFAGWAKKLTGVPTIAVGSVDLTGEFIAAYGGEASRPASLDDLLRRLTAATSTWWRWDVSYARTRSRR